MHSRAPFAAASVTMKRKFLNIKSRSTIAGGVRGGPSSPRSNVQLVTNPMSDEDRQHLYQSVCQPQSQEHIYHTLEPPHMEQQQIQTLEGAEYDTLGRLDVMLPNGQVSKL